MANSKT